MDIIQEAQSMGWHDKEAHVAKGKSEDSWVDADTYVEKGRHIIPIINERNKKLIAELSTLRAENSTLKGSLEEVQASVKDLVSFHEESTKAQVEKARKEILASLKVAKSEGDVDAEIELTSTLSSFDAAAQAAKGNPPKPFVAEVPTNGIHPQVQAWMVDNDWYGVDQKKTGLMDGAARELKASNPGLWGKALLDAAKAEVDAFMGERKSPIDKTEGGGRGGSSGNGGGSGSTGGYNDLPADAKSICIKQVDRFVGPNKAFKDVKAWQSHYATQYFKGA